MLDTLLKDKQEKIERLEAFEIYWEKQEQKRKSNQSQIENKYSYHYNDLGKVVLDTNNSKEEIQEMGKNIISDAFYDTGYKIAKGLLRDEVEKVERKIKKFLKEQKKQNIVKNTTKQYKIF